jgi:hypothetical protein
MCIEATVQGDTAQCTSNARPLIELILMNLARLLFPFSLDVLRSTGAQKLGWMAMYVFIYLPLMF